jgi:hypothetical protein
MIYVSEPLKGDRFIVYNDKTKETVTGFEDELYDLFMWLFYRLEIDQKWDVDPEKIKKYMRAG